MRGLHMKKTFCMAKYLSEANVNAIKETCSRYGYDVTFVFSEDEADRYVAGKGGASLDFEVAYLTNARLLPLMKELRWCQTANAGVDNLLKTGLFDSGDIILTNSSGAYGLAISEHIMMVTLMLLRRMPEYIDRMAARQWKNGLAIRSVMGSNIAIVGTGNLGSTAAEKFKALGAACVTGFSRSGKAAEPFDLVYKMDEFTENVSEADVVVMCVPETPETIGLLSAQRIAALPEKAYVINVGRGTTVDQDALIKVLNEGRIAGAALDVVVPEPLPEDHPLWSVKNCMLTPHSSGDMGLEYSNDVTVDIFCENLRRYAEGEEMIKIVDPARGY